MTSPFHAQLGPKRVPASRFVSPAVVAAVVCLVLGVLAVAWHTQTKSSNDHTRAQAEAKSRAALLQLELGRAVSAGEVLGNLARQTAGGSAGFLQTASVLHAAFPELASLELQPGGVVSDVVPRTGNARAVGLNVFNDPAHRASANAALQSGVLTVSAPLPLSHGEPGLVVRAPVFQKDRAGTNRFWGFVAVSMGLPDAFRRAGLNELGALGYEYALFIPLPGGRSSVLAHGGLNRLEDSVLQPFRVQNLEMRLALRRRGGWIRYPRLLAECAGVVCGSLLVGGFLFALSSSKRAERECTRANRSVEEETARRTQAQEALLHLNASLESARSASATQEKAVEEMAVKYASLEAAFHKARADADDLQARLDRNVESHEKDSSANQGQLAELQEALRAAEQKISQLEGACAEALRSAEAAGAKLRQQETKANAAVAGWQDRIEAQKEDFGKQTAAEAEKLRAAEAVIRDLEGQIKAAKRQDPREAEQEPEPLPPKTDPKPVPESEPALPPTASLVSEANPAGSAEHSPPAPEPIKRKRGRQKERNQIELFGAEPGPAKETEAGADEGEAGTAESPEPSAEAETSEPPSSDVTIEDAPQPRTPRTERTVAPDHKTAPRPSIDPAQFRRAVHEMLPLLAEGDPGAKDCFKANRSVFRSAYPPAGYEEFEQLVKAGTFDQALELLTRLARKHGMNV